MKILYVTTISSTINAFLLPHIELLMNLGHRVDIACNITKPINKVILDRGCKIFEIKFSRSPLDINNISAYKKLKKLILEEKYDIVHTHTPVASAIARLVCKKLSNVKVIYTAHGFHFYKGATLKNWLVYYPIEKWLSKFTDVLITINSEDYERAINKLKPKKVVYSPGVGLNIRKLKSITIDKSRKRLELGVPIESKILLSVGELNKNKNHETIIKALSKLKGSNIYYLICGNGPLQEHLLNLSRKLGLENHVKLLGYRYDVGEICKASDVFVLPSFREGLSVALMEAMACGLPVICSDIRGNRDLIKDEKGGYLVKPNKVNEFSMKIEQILSISNGERDKMALYNKEVIKNFDINNVLSLIQSLYL